MLKQQPTLLKLLVKDKVTDVIILLVFKQNFGTLK